MKKYLRILFVIIIVGCILYFAIHLDQLSVETILSYTPENPVFAAIVLFMMYALKSVSVVFPLMILQIAASRLFSTPIAIVVNIIGAAITLSTPYIIARFSGEELVDQLKEKHPKLKSFIEEQHTNTFLMTLLVRMIGFLPGDVISMYFGATKTPYLSYLIASLLGLLPGVIMITLAGTSIDDPTSPTFIISSSYTIIMTILAPFLYKKFRKKKEQ